MTPGRARVYLNWLNCVAVVSVQEASLSLFWGQSSPFPTTTTVICLRGTYDPQSEFFLKYVYNARRKTDSLFALWSLSSPYNSNRSGTLPEPVFPFLLKPL